MDQNNIAELTAGAVISLLAGVSFLEKEFTAVFTGWMGWNKNLEGGVGDGEEKKSLCPDNVSSAAQKEQVLKPILAVWSWVMELSARGN